MQQTRKQHREYMRLYYKKYPGLARKLLLKSHTPQRDFMLKAKCKPCSDCGFQYKPWQMQFDHRNPKEKLFCISDSWKRSMEVMKLEMEKCDVVCANCHANRTYFQRRNHLI